MRLFLLFGILLPSLLSAQPDFFDTFQFSHADSLRGKITQFRNYDVIHYDLEVSFDIEKQSIEGQNTIHFRVPGKRKRIQVDLFNNLKVNKISLQGIGELQYERDGNAIFIDHESFEPKTDYWLTIAYEGAPIIAKKPPWDGGFVWTKDSITGKPWVAVACEGLGASSWWPCKDHLSDEPDSMCMRYTVPNELKAIGNGRYQGSINLGMSDKTTYEWKVHYPINTYNVTFYIGDYHAALWQRRQYNYESKSDITYYGEMEKTLSQTNLEEPVSFYYLDHSEYGLISKQKFNIEDSLEHLLTEYQLKTEITKRISFINRENTIRVLPEIIGPYPFPKDGYKLVEAPFWGMEHQSAIAYGNNYKLNDFGFDFIILHESGHEWFGNLISAGDHADMWIHEAFTTYLEALYLEYIATGGFKRYINQSMSQIGWGGSNQPVARGPIHIDYLHNQRAKIKNQMPIQGPRDVNFNEWPDADMYYKGTWMLHTLRTLVENDSLWFATLRGMADSFAFKPVYTEDIIAYLSGELDKDLTAFFDQYLNYASIPTLEYYYSTNGKETTLHYRYVDVAADFDMPTIFLANGLEKKWIFPDKEWNSVALKNYDKTKAHFDNDHFLIDFVEIEKPDK